MRMCNFAIHTLKNPPLIPAATELKKEDTQSNNNIASYMSDDGDKLRSNKMDTYLPALKTDIITMERTNFVFDFSMVI